MQIIKYRGRIYWLYFSSDHYFLFWWKIVYINNPFWFVTCCLKALPLTIVLAYSELGKDEKYEPYLDHHNYLDNLSCPIALLGHNEKNLGVMKSKILTELLFSKYYMVLPKSVWTINSKDWTLEFWIQNRELKKFECENL